ncbi:hypothetical protein SAMN05720470_1083 [Fibrobacter sp. UWOV1]|uniref:hypothetical protein n=1 Tax=Fibrobacter sp. UWOV1 TaxID=1896215 RepID=UPI00091DBDAE|nr:hypothetical protein [Fibrobacter sp. UWOV1]SHL40784.1 hypothetical protein SAMN05720470_1083 [Fibrobacter sp. UWOV1]
MEEKKKQKNKPVAITPLAYKTLHELVEKNPKVDGSPMKLCEMASSLIMRAAKE